MQHLEVSGVVRLVYRSLGVKGLLCYNSSVGIATRYGLEDPGIESRWGMRLALGPTQPPVQCVPGLSQG